MSVRLIAQRYSLYAYYTYTSSSRSIQLSFFHVVNNAIRLIRSVLADPKNEGESVCRPERDIGRGEGGNEQRPQNNEMDFESRTEQTQFIKIPPKRLFFFFLSFGIVCCVSACLCAGIGCGNPPPPIPPLPGSVSGQNERLNAHTVAICYMLTYPCVTCLPTHKYCE